MEGGTAQRTNHHTVTSHVLSQHLCQSAWKLSYHYTLPEPSAARASTGTQSSNTGRTHLEHRAELLCYSQIMTQLGIAMRT